MKFDTFLKVLLVGGMLVFMLFFNIGCDGSFVAKGVVYEWLNPPAGEMGNAYIEPDKPANGLNYSPLSAQITFLDRAGSQGPGCSRPSPEFIQNQRLNTISDSDGKFEIGEVVSPGTYPMKITISE